MAKIEIPFNSGNRMAIMVLVVLPFAFFAWLEHGVAALLFFAIPLTPAMLIFGWSLWSVPVKTEIDPATRLVMCCYRSIFGKSRIKSYSLDQFRYVRSYITIGRFPVNVVELVTNSGGEALCLTRVEPSASSQSFFSIPRPGEAEKAKKLRCDIASSCGVVDKGYLGYRMPGCQLK
ncbi:hypothetical protein [Noviherbaspirillum sp.]|uniref:hypothetical protein n=1 Tax=Noviherbaspirillum sp. TaxID=1926288 RepID=UPI002FE2D80C